MGAVLQVISPKSKIGSLGIACLAHLALYGGILIFLNGHYLTTEKLTFLTENLSYEQMNEPPVIRSTQKIVIKNREIKAPSEKQRVNLGPRELQDEKSAVTGTQVAATLNPEETGAEGASDAMTTPYYRINPKYPRAALIEGLEGWVTLKIDVNEEGSVENVRVIGGERRNLFQDEARRAVEKWKYKPFLGPNGKPVKKANREIRVDFKLRDAV